MGKRLALLIGVSQYGEGFEPLPGSLQDLQAMEAVLKNPDCGAFELQPLENCNRPTLEAEIEQFFRSRDREDLLLLYFSGHGDLGSGGMLHQQLHLCTRNTYKQQGRLVESGALSAAFLKRQMDLSKSQQIGVILDCCYSGAIADLLKKGEGDIDFGALQAKGRVILASSSGVQVALQAVDGLSLYTRYLIEGMKGAAYPGQGEWIAARNLHEYAERRFEIASKGGYLPKIIAEETSFNLPIVRAPKPDPKLDYQKTVDRIFQELDQDLGLDFTGVIEDELDRGRLETRRDLLKISPEDAKTIEEQVQQPYLVRAEQRRRYAAYFKMAVRNNKLPTPRDRRRLAEIRQNLLLGEEDAARIEEALTQPLNLNPVPTVPVPPEAPAPTPQPPGQSSRYQQLEKYLQNQQWQKADEETYRLMITTVGKEAGQWFDRADLENFPCADLRTLDQLWANYSKTKDYPNGKWGFSVQKQIWQECGSPMEYNDDWRKFGDRVGWRKDGDWVDYDDLSFDLQKSLRGEFPGVWVGVGWFCGVVGFFGLGGVGGVLLSRNDLPTVARASPESS
jgi:hypothetical protein